MNYFALGSVAVNSHILFKLPRLCNAEVGGFTDMNKDKVVFSSSPSVQSMYLLTQLLLQVVLLFSNK